MTGIGYDRDTLQEAGIVEAGAFAAVSNGDNSNIIAARVARETFGVEKVVARIYDPRRAEIYERLGIPTVATVRWTADQMLRRLLPSGGEALWLDPTGAVQLTEIHVGHGWVGSRLSKLEQAAGIRVALVTRLGHGMLPTPDSCLQEGDLVYAMMRPEDQADVEQVLAKGPEGH